MLIVVELDSLPIKARNNLFAPDRLGFVESEETRKLQDLVVEFIKEWDELTDFDKELLRRALSDDRHGRSTIGVAQQIARALQFKGGFAQASGNGSGGQGNKRRKKLAKAELYPDPTTIEGVQSLTVEQGATRGTRFHINAKDKFLSSGRGELVVTSTHPDLGNDEITVGTLHDGFVRVMIAVPDTAELGDYLLTASLTGWSKSVGGIGADLVWETALTVVESVDDDEREKRRRESSSGDVPAAGGQPAVRWKRESDFEDWHGGIPGHVEDVPAAQLAETDEYKYLAKLGDQKISTIFLNEDYRPLKRYEQARPELTERGRDSARDRFAVGTGLALLLLHRETAKLDPPPSEAMQLAAKQAAAEATLVMMPQYDKLAQKAGIADESD